ncbi:arginyl-trna synthetase [Phaffia rhodozyma]|uniref:arginine--tRNA ligase n=1 Tax=Phaffia rhodozyma TaxID=264483 RepID=A0A0F7SHG0_PHARH|nr:arginyl-trna synthetase [Phaffia rhodozyma]
MASSSSEAPKPFPKINFPELPAVEGIAPERSIIDNFRVAIAAQIAPVIGKTPDEVYVGVDVPNKRAADFQVAVARFRLGGKPDDWAQKIVDAFAPNEYVSKVTLGKGGTLSYYINRASLARVCLDQIRSFPNKAPDDPTFEKNSYGSWPSFGEGKKVVVEFSSPNIAKPFHAGHLRSTIIGAFLSNLYETCGWEVLRINYLGDWGKQFGLLAIGFKKHGNEQALQDDAIKHLFDVYVQINKDMEAEKLEGSEATEDEARAFFKAMEDGDETALALWARFRDYSIEKYKSTYGRLNIHFDVYSGESQVKTENMVHAVDRLQEMGIVVEKDKALIADLTKYKLESAVVRKKDGTTIYITRDIGAAKERYEEYKFDKMIYVVASQQNLHLAQFFKVLELMGYSWAQNGTLQHINFGMVLGMSTRKGTVKFLNDILEEAASTMMEQMQRNQAKYEQIVDPVKCADVLGMSAVKIQDMSAKRHLDYTFNLKKMTAFEGDTGVYIQYAHVRLASLERKNPNVVLPSDLSLINTDLLTEDKAHDIIYLLSLYPDTVKLAYKLSEPSTIVTYIFRLAHAISAAWDSVRVQSSTGVDPEVAKARLYLFLCARDVLGSGMRLLTLTPLDRM